MFFLLQRLVVLLTLLSTAYSKILAKEGCNQGTESQDIDTAIDDTVEVAKVAARALASGKINGREDLFDAAYGPLFPPEDKVTLLRTFVKLSIIKIAPPDVTFFCTEDHITWNVNKNYWMDLWYGYGNGRYRMRVPVSSGATRPGSKGSYTTLGFKYDDTGDYDTSGLAHIFLAADRRRPPSGTARDLRRYPDIAKDGLDGRYARIEDIKPLAQTVMHELIHAVGGLANPNKGVSKIGDGPDKDTYGWLACNKRRINGDSNIDIADCITFLGQAIYLSQIQGKDTFWTTGEVDPKTLRPQYLGP